jgi:acyl carrier protein
VSEERLKATLRGQLSAILVELLDVDPAVVRPRARLREDLGMDELDFVELIMEAEEEWQIEIPDGDVVEETADTKGGKWKVRAASSDSVLGYWKLKTVDDWATYLARRLGS